MQPTVTFLAGLSGHVNPSMSASANMETSHVMWDNSCDEQLYILLVALPHGVHFDVLSFGSPVVHRDSVTGDLFLNVFQKHGMSVLMSLRFKRFQHEDNFNVTLLCRGKFQSLLCTEPNVI